MILEKVRKVDGHVSDVAANRLTIGLIAAFHGRTPADVQRVLEAGDSIETTYCIYRKKE